MNDNRKREIRREAEFIREKCKKRRYGILDLFKECENLGYKLVRYPLGENSDLGFVTKKDNEIVIFTNSSSRLSREIFTLAHEIGHAVLHIGAEESFVDNSFTINDSNENQKEREANYFAACLLMPIEEVRRYIDLEIQSFYNKGVSAMDIARIMSEFCVSFDMALNRLENIGMIDIDQKMRLDIEKVENRVSNLLKSVGGNARLNCQSNEIVLPYEYIDYAIFNYNHNAVPRETLERVLAYYKLTIEDVKDKIVEHSEVDYDLDELIGGLAD